MIDALLSEIAADRLSGASELLPKAVRALRLARERGRGPLLDAARRVTRAQPAMAPLWKAAGYALADPDGSLLDRLEHQAARAPHAIARAAADVVALRPPQDGPHPLHIVTCSNSGTVRAALTSLGSTRAVAVACAEGRPNYEGRQLAEALARERVQVDVFTDAAIGQALRGADAVWVGADAVGPFAFVNKVGTGLLVTAAAAAGIPAYVLASFDKVLPEQWFEELGWPQGPADEVWRTRPETVQVRNPYFEAAPLASLSGVLTDRGSLPPDELVAACSAEAVILTEAILSILTGPDKEIPEH